MLTPRFKLSQDDNHVYITIHAPYTNIADSEIDVDGENFLFVSSPYFLRLCLPGKIVENERSKGSYTCESGEFNLTFDKEMPGEHFENLDMITSLLAPREIPDLNPSLVESLEEEGVTIEDESEAVISSDTYAYGFANKVTAEFNSIGREFPQIFECKTPENVAASERHKLRVAYENRKFSSDHYLADFYDHELLAPYLEAIVAWNKPDFNKDLDFTDDEVSILKELPNKHYLLTKNEHTQIMLGLVDILFGYCYDKRTTVNDSNVESGWTINKLSPTLTWFCTFSETKQVLIACYRRALSFPIFRNFELCKKVKNDLVSLLRKGKRVVIKSVIEIHQMFNASSDARYILNQLYIKDYLVFLQKLRSEELDELTNNIANIEITKNDLDLEIEELEEAAELVKEEHTEIMENEIALKMASMSLIPGLKKTNLWNVRESDDETTLDSSSDSSSENDSSDLDSDDEPSCKE